MVVHGGIHVFVNSRKLAVPSRTITGNDLIKLAGYPEPMHWDLYRLQSEKDPTGGSLVTGSDILTIKDGDFFRVIEGHRSIQ
jgi:ribosomal protein S4